MKLIYYEFGLFYGQLQGYSCQLKERNSFEVLKSTKYK